MHMKKAYYLMNITLITVRDYIQYLYKLLVSKYYIIIN